MNSQQRNLSCLEFFCGIGGLRLALSEACRSINEEEAKCPIVTEIIKGYDVNTNANRVYFHNFGEYPVPRGIDHLIRSDIDGLADMWLLSPPCPPYTRGGKQMDKEDPRAAALSNLIKILGECADPPKLVFLENVRGFELSSSRDDLIAALESQKYTIEEYLLSPTQLGIPNTRVRYYCLAYLTTKASRGNTSAIKIHFPHLRPNTDEEINRISIGEFLCEHTDEELNRLDANSGGLNTDDEFQFDIVVATSLASSTFTKGYGINFGRGGPLLEYPDNGNVSELIDLHMPTDAQTHIYNTGRLHPSRFRAALTAIGKLRYFSPQEMLNLHGFPERFSFPESTTMRQRWALIGNSISIQVVSALIAHLLRNGWMTSAVDNQNVSSC